MVGTLIRALVAVVYDVLCIRILYGYVRRRYERAAAGPEPRRFRIAVMPILFLLALASIAVTTMAIGAAWGILATGLPTVLGFWLMFVGAGWKLVRLRQTPNSN
jgi:hypothetical protein